MNAPDLSAWRPDGGPQLSDAGWRVLEGAGVWRRQADQLVLRGNGSQWCTLELPPEAASALRAGNEVAVDVTVSGTAAAAGLSLGPFLDFLAPLPAGSRPRRLSLELHPDHGAWTFLVDARLTSMWWPGRSRPRHLLPGVPLLKALRPDEVQFNEVTVRQFPARCRLSVVLTCHRFLQRLRVVLRNWCHQDATPGAFEVIVVNPNSPDGTHEHLAAVAASFPQVRVRELFTDAPADKPILINQGVRASSGDWVWLSDADCLFPVSAVSLVLRRMDRARSSCPQLLFGSRYHLSRNDTDALLAMALDGICDFEELAARADPGSAEHYPWGYTQIVPRQILTDVPYREDMPQFAHSDGAFVNDCRRRGIPSRALDGLSCLHLQHPFAWYGTDIFC